MGRFLSFNTILEIIIVIALICIPGVTIIIFGACGGLTYLFICITKTKSKKMLRKEMNGAYYNPSSETPILYGSLSIPSYGKKDVFVIIRSAAINPIDFKVNTAQFPFYRWVTQNNVGYDFSGVILDVGSQVTKFKVGDKVFGNAYGGSLQEYSVCREDDIALMPDNVSFDEVACLGLAGTTALQSLKWFGDISSQELLIIGASGGVGNIGMQIASYYNAPKLYGVCSNKNISFVQSVCPSASMVDYSQDIQAQIGSQTFDLIFDTVTSPNDENQELIYGKYLKPDGKYVTINGVFGFIGGFITSTYVNWRWLEPKNHHLHCLVWNTPDLDIISQMVKEEKLKIKYEAMPFTYANIIEGFNKLKGRRTVGKIAFTVSTNESI